MQTTIDPRIARELGEFDLPAYHEIPNVGLFLEQVMKYTGEYLLPLDGVSLTASMISNYVKKGIIRNPVKKQYDREQIAALFFIAVAKPVVSLEDIQLLLRLREETYPCDRAYEYFRQELKAALSYVSGTADTLPAYTERNKNEKYLLRSTIMTAAHKIYLEKYFRMLREGAAED